MSVDLSSLLSKKANEIEKPKPMPAGHYGWMVGSYKPVQSQKKGTNGLEFEVTPFEAKDDVDQDELAQVKEPFKKPRRLTFWITEDSLFRLVEFFAILGIDAGDKEIIEVLPETMGCQFIAPLTQVMRENGDFMAVLDDNKISAYE